MGFWKRLILNRGNFEGHETYLDKKAYWRYCETHRLVHRDIAYKKLYAPHKHIYSKPFSSYVIHHKDGNKTNNDPYNLELLSWEEHNKKHSGCFIATAAYGTPLDYRIDILRMFRDNTLNNNFSGKLFIKLYYYFSPRVAAIIRSSNLLKCIIRCLLSPIILYLGERRR